MACILVFIFFKVTATAAKCRGMRQVLGLQPLSASDSCAHKHLSPGLPDRGGNGGLDWSAHSPQWPGPLNSTAVGSFPVLRSTKGSSIPPMGRGLPARSSVRNPSPASHLRRFLSSHNKVAPPRLQSPGQELCRFFKKCGVEEVQGRPCTPTFRR